MEDIPEIDRKPSISAEIHSLRGRNRNQLMEEGKTAGPWFNQAKWSALMMRGKIREPCETKKEKNARMQLNSWVEKINISSETTPLWSPREIPFGIESEILDSRDRRKKWGPRPPIKKSGKKRSWMRKKKKDLETQIRSSLSSLFSPSPDWLFGLFYFTALNRGCGFRLRSA